MSGESIEFDFFLAHAGDDTVVAEQLFGLLDGSCRVFMDSKSLLPGDLWDVELPAAQRASAVTVAVVSRSTDGAHYQLEEIAEAIQLARSEDRRVVPVYLDGMPDRPPYGLRRVHSLAVSPSLPLEAVAAELLQLVGDDAAAPEVRRRPVGVPSPPDVVVSRDDLYVRLRDAVTGDTRVAVTGVVGAGGFGKTTLAAQVCVDPVVVEYFSGRILWVTLGEAATTREHAVPALGRLYEAVTGASLGVTEPDVGADRVAAVLADSDWLVVVDDVWARPVLDVLERAVGSATVVVTTRQGGLVDDWPGPVEVTEMSTEQSMELLAVSAGGGDDGALSHPVLRELAERLDGWALLVELAARQLRRRVRRGQSLAEAAGSLVERHRRRGAVAFDARSPDGRTDAIAWSVSISLEVLAPQDAVRCTWLGILPEDADVPLQVVGALWQVDLDEAEDLALELDEASLISYDLSGQTVRLHDELCSVFAAGLGNPGLLRLETSQDEARSAASLHRRLVDECRVPSDMPVDYAWEYLAYHAEQAGRLDDLVENASLLPDVGPPSLLPILHDLERPRAIEIGRVYQAASHHLTRPRRPDSVAYLTLAAHELRHPELASAILDRAPAPPWFARWAATRQGTHHRVLAGVLRGAVAAVALHPRADGSQIVLAIADDGMARAWKLATGESVLEPVDVVQDHEVTAVAVGSGPNGLPVAVTGDRNGIVRVWDVQSGQQLGPPMEGHKGGVRAVAIGTGRHGRSLAVSGSAGYTVRVWDLESVRPIGNPLEGHTDWVRAVAIGTGRDGRSLAVSGSDDNTVRVWDLESVRPIGNLLEGHTDWVRAVAIGTGRDGRSLAVSGSDDNTVRVWDLESLRPVGNPLEGHKRGVRAVAIGTGRDGRSLAVSGSDDNTVRVWDLESLRPVVNPLEGHGRTVSSVAIAAAVDGRARVVSGSHDSTVRVWELPAGQPAETTPEVQDWVSSVAVGVGANNRPVAVSGGYDGAVRLWNLASGELIAGPLEGHVGGVTSIAVGVGMDDRPLVVSGGLDGRVLLWDFTSSPPTVVHVQDRAHDPLDPDSGPIYVEIGTGARGRPIVVWSCAWRTYVWDLMTEKAELSYVRARFGMAIGNLPDGRPVLATGGMSVVVHDLTTNTWVGRAFEGHLDAVNAVAVGLSADGRPVVASAGDDHTVRVSDLATGEPVGEPFEGHHGSVTCLAVGVAADGRAIVVSGGADQTVRVWDLESRNELVAIATTYAIEGVALFDDQAKDAALAIASRRGMVVVDLSRVMASSPQ